MEETEKEREERLKEWENFLEEGEGEGGKRDGNGRGKDSTATSTHQSRGEDKVCVLLFHDFRVAVGFGCRKVVKAEKDILSL